MLVCCRRTVCNRISLGISIYPNATALLTLDFRFRQAIHAVLTHLRLLASVLDSVFRDFGFISALAAEGPGGGVSSSAG